MTETQQHNGIIYGVGLGPGAADLMSVRSDRLIRGAAHIAYFRKKGNPGQARQIVEGLLRADVVEWPMDYPVTTEIPLSDPRYNQLLAAFYQDWADRLSELASQQGEVIVLCEGDPFFYGSFMHLYERLRDRHKVDVVPGITGMSAAWTASGQPISWGDDKIAIVMGTSDEDELTASIEQADAIVVMKIGRHLGKIRRILTQAGHAERAVIVCYAASEKEEVIPLSDYPSDRLPYFSIILVHGRGRRP